MLMHNESGKWFRWSEHLAKHELRTKTLVIHQFPKCKMQCVWWV